MVSLINKTDDWLWDYIDAAENNNTMHHSISTYEDAIDEMWKRMINSKSECYTNKGLYIFCRKDYFEKCSSPSFRGLKTHLKNNKVAEELCEIMCD